MLTVPPTNGQNQTHVIVVPDTIAYKYLEWEEGPWAMLPYANLYPPPASQTPAWEHVVPPPIYRTDIWSAMQTWPL
jgi:hypothetical protein